LGISSGRDFTSIKLEKYVDAPATIIRNIIRPTCHESILCRLLNAKRPERNGRRKPLL
jgi:hypothetical protein